MNSMDTLNTLNTLVHFALIAVAGCGLASGANPAGANMVTIRNRSGVAQTNYPLQIGRPFAAGEILAFPQVGICADSGCAAVDQWLPTQADVKTRFGDGSRSVKHAILSVLLPSLPAESTPVYLTFRNQSDCHCGAISRVSKAEMLDLAYGLDARITADFGAGSVLRSAREMLQAWDGVTTAEPLGPAWYWQEGSIASTIILADHWLDRAWDFGSDNYRSLRPIFHLTFWPALKAVKVRVIVENSNSQAVQDQTYAVTVDVRGSPQYRHARFTHTALTNWSRVFWIGASPAANVDIDYNLAYLASTNAVPNFDPRHAPSEAWIASAYSAWLKAPNDLYDSGPGSPYLGWDKAMGDAGGRPDIGPYPKWHVLWLYTGDYRLRQYALGLTEMASAWPARVREFDPAKYLDRAHSVPGIGHPVSISTRPTTNFTTGFDYSYTAIGDRLRVVGTVSNAGWRFDDAHQPEPWSISYLLTGDYYYLEQGEFWAAFCAHLPNGSSIHNGEIGRGPTGAEGGLDYLQIRAEAWMLRSRVELAELAPDSSPWKDLLKVWINDAIAQREGAWNLTATVFAGDPNWLWGREYILPQASIDRQLPPNGGFQKGDRSFVQESYGLDPKASSAAFSLFETDYYAYAIGRAAELGYPTGNLVTYLGRLYTNLSTNPDFNPYLLQSGRYPTVKSDGTYYNSGELVTGWFATESQARAATEGQGGPPVWRGVSSFPLNDPENGYEFLAAAAISFLTREPAGADAWNFALANIVNANSVQGNNPKWALLPRSAAAALPLGIATAALPDASAAYAQALCAFGGVGTYSWSVPAGSGLPPGLTLSADGFLAGTASQAATFTVMVTDVAGASASRALRIAVSTDPAAAAEAPGRALAQPARGRNQCAASGRGQSPQNRAGRER